MSGVRGCCCATNRGRDVCGPGAGPAPKGGPPGGQRAGLSRPRERGLRRVHESDAADADPALAAAHKHCGSHRAELAASTLWGCFYCLAKYPPSPDVECNGGTTARCLRCGIDAVLGDAAGFPLTGDFLERMHLHWFGLGQQLDPANGKWVDVMVLSQIPKIAERQLLPFARDLASAIAQSDADASAEAEEELTFAMAEGKRYGLPPGARAEARPPSSPMRSTTG